MTDVNRTSAAQAVAEALKAEKVEFVFGLAGSHVLAIYDALADAPQIRHVQRTFPASCRAPLPWLSAGGQDRSTWTFPWTSFGPRAWRQRLTSHRR